MLFAGQIVEDVAGIEKIIFVIKCQLADSRYAEDEFAEGIFQTAHFDGFSLLHSFFSDGKEVKRQRRRSEKLLASGVAVVEHVVTKC